MVGFGGSALSKTLGIVFGVLTILLGVYSIMTPLQTYGVVSWLIAFAMIADGVAKIMLWWDERALGISDIWALVGGIASVALGVALASSQVAQFAVDVFIAYVVSGWLLATGIVRIVRSFTLRDIHKSLGTRLGSNWDLALIMGILMVMAGILCFANPVVVMITLGWQVGFALVLGGIGLITATV